MEQIVKIGETNANDVSLATNLSPELISIRVSPNNYLAVFFIASFFTGFLIYLEKDLAAAILCAAGWLLIPSLALTDRIIFDGENLYRKGVIPNFWQRLSRQPNRIKISQIEQVETQALRALKRGGNIFYRYRTSVRGNNLRIVFASGGEDYRKMVHKLFDLLPLDTLDNRSIELRDYLNEPKEILMKAEFERIPSMEVLEASVNRFQKIDNKSPLNRKSEQSGDADFEKARDLRVLANELRLSGNLLQALETFRRALLLNPSAGWLIFEFARCLHSYASVERNRKLGHKANAALRLAEQKADRDTGLISRIGESYFQYGDWERAKNCFNKTLSVAPENFRAVRGLAEIALREGKIAHVIHHFATAIHFADSKALKCWAQNETEYFSRLNGDEDYMESEIKRINRLERVERAKVFALRLAIAGFALVIIGLLFDETLANTGWLFSSITIILWAGLVTSRNILLERSPILEVED